MTSFPSTIPLPFVDYSGNVRNATIRSSEDNGYMYRRSRFNTAYTDLTVSWVLSPTQYALFKTFFDTTLSNGASQFEVELRYPKNTELTEWVARFGAGHEDQYEEGMWNVSAPLELLRPTIFAAVADPVGYQAFEVEPVPFDPDYAPFYVEGNPFHVQLS